VIRTGLGVLVGGSQYLRASTGKPIFSLDLLDLEALRTHSVPLEFLAHGFATKPGEETVAALFEKRGPNAAVVELLEARVRPIVAGPGRKFYGHGLFSPDASQLYAVEIDTETHEGLLSVRDASSFEVTGEIPTGGKNPHDALLLDDGKTLVVTNGGGALGSDAAASVAFIDLPSRRVVDIVPIPDENLNAGHVAIGKDGSIAVVSAPRDGLPGATSLGGLSLRHGARGSLERMQEPRDVTARMVGESLSVAIHESTGIVAATHPYGSVLTLWNLAQRRMLRSFDLVSARGVTVTLDGRYFAVSHGLNGSLSLLDPATMELVAGETMEVGRFTGSHVYAWRMPGGAAFAPAT
jgi:uncharacterized protein